MSRVYRHLRRRLDRRALLSSWQRAEEAGTIDPRIPHPSINYNQQQASSFEGYVHEFTESACNHELPALLEIAEFSDNDDGFTLLDYGCGLGRLGYAFTERFGHDDRRRYIGYEIHPDAVAFLRSAYADYPSVSLLSDRLVLSDSYVEIGQGAKAGDGIEAEQVELASRVAEEIDLEFTHSVFTHMYREPIGHVLREFREVMPAGVCVNTWLLVDDEARANLASGLADRVLPIRGDGFWTYDRKNPLICTAYDIDVMRKIYDDAGHDIVDVRWGTWSGRQPTQEFTYQDVVISRPRTSPV